MIKVGVDHFLYVPVASLWEDYRQWNDPPLGPCQTCRRPGPKERFSLNARELGF